MTTQYPPTVTESEDRADLDPARVERTEDLYRRHRSDGVRFARRRGADDPEGLFDHVFTDVMAKADGLDGDPDDAVAAYLYRSITNRVIAENRKQRVPMVTYDERHHGEKDPYETFDDAVVRSEWVRDLLSNLTQAEREVVIHRYFDDRSSSETAEVLDKSPEAVRQLHRSAIRRLRFVLAIAAVVVLAVLAIAALRTSAGNPVSTAPAESQEDSSTVISESDEETGAPETNGQDLESATVDGPPSEQAVESAEAASTQDVGGTEADVDLADPATDLAEAELPAPVGGALGIAPDGDAGGADPASIPVQSGNGQFEGFETEDEQAPFGL